MFDTYTSIMMRSASGEDASRLVTHTPVDSSHIHQYTLVYSLVRILRDRQHLDILTHVVYGLVGTLTRRYFDFDRDTHTFTLNSHFT